VIEIRPIVQATGPDNPARQISVNNWNLGHRLTASPQVIVGTDALGVGAEYPLASFTMDTELAAAIDGIHAELGGYVTDAELTSALANYSLVGHHHAISDVNGLQAALDSKANVAALDAYATDAELAAGLATKANTTDLANYIPLTQKGAANGVVPLDGTIKISAIYLPSYVDDVLEYANLAAFPATGETGKIYVALDTGKTYRWTGSAYTEISSSTGGVWGTITGVLSNQIDLQTALNAKAADAIFTTSVRGLVPPSGLGITNFLRADGAWAVPPGTATSAVWGNITGTLSAQTDLQAALNGKSDTGHTHDTRYYTEAEVDALIAAASGGGSLGGGWKLQASWAWSTNVPEVTFTGLAGVSDILVISEAVVCATSGVPSLFVSTNNGASYYTTNGDYKAYDGAGASISTTGFSLAGTNATSGRSGAAIIYACNAVGGPRLCWQPSSNPQRVFVADNTKPLNAIRLAPSNGGNFTAGAFFVFVRTGGAGTVDDTAYGPSWDGITLVAPSKNAVYDKIESLALGGGAYLPLVGGTLTGDLTVRTPNPAVNIWADGFVSSLHWRTTYSGSDYLVGSITSYLGSGLQVNGNSTVELRANNAVIATVTPSGIGMAAGTVLTVADDPYGAGWDGSAAVPTKNAVFDALAGKASTSALANYLPLTGGSLSGNLALATTNPTLTLQGDASSYYGGIFINGAAWSSSIQPYGGLIFDTTGTHTFQIGGVSKLNISTVVASQIPITVPDEAYGASWDGSLQVPTKNALWDKIETLGGGGAVSDTAYGLSWNGVTTIAPSKNAVYDQMEVLNTALVGKANSSDVTNMGALKVDKTIAGTNSFESTGGSYGKVKLTIGSIVGMHGALFETDASILAGVDLVDFSFKSASGQSTMRYERRASQIAAANAFEFQFDAAAGTPPIRLGAGGSSFVGKVNIGYPSATAYGTPLLNVNGTGNFVGAVTIPDEAYGASWDGKLEAATKNAIYDKIQTLGGGGVTTFNTRSGAVTLTSADVTGALTYTPVNKAGDRMSGNLLFDATYGFVMDTPASTVKVRLKTLSGVSAWGGFLLNADLGATLNLDDTAKNGWFFKLDGRSNVGDILNGLWAYRIPQGANPHSDEVAMFGVTNGFGYFRQGISIGNTTVAAPAGGAALDVTGNAVVSGTLNVGGTLSQGGSAVALASSLANYIPTSQKAAASGVASLDASTKVPAAQLPITASVSAPSGGADGDIWLVYT